MYLKERMCEFILSTLGNHGRASSGDGTRCYSYLPNTTLLFWGERPGEGKPDSRLYIAQVRGHSNLNWEGSRGDGDLIGFTSVLMSILTGFAYRYRKYGECRIKDNCYILRLKDGRELLVNNLRLFKGV